MAGAPLRHGGGSGVASMVVGAGIHVQPDAFADVTAAAAVQASQHLPQLHRNLSGGGYGAGNPFADPVPMAALAAQPLSRRGTGVGPRLSSSSSFGEWSSSAWPPGGPSDGPLGAAMPAPSGALPAPCAQLSSLSLNPC
jgi:hypothetical protein